MRLLGGVLSLLAVLLCSAATAVAAPTVVEFPAGKGPWGIATGADGNLWFADAPNPGAIGRVSTGGTVATYAGGQSGLSKDAQPKAIAAGPSGVWFTENGKNKVGRVAPDGTVTEFPGGTHDHPIGITTGPDGNVWFVATGKHGAVLRMTPSGTITEWGTPTADSDPQDIAVGPDGNLWFTEPAKRRIGRITPLGTITEFDGTAALGGGSPQQITAGPDGNLWFTIGGLSPAIGRISTQGVYSAPFTVGLPGFSAPADITAGADGNLYFTDNGANVIGRVTPGGIITTVGGITAAAGLQGITTGSDGRIWFAESAKAKLGRLSVAPAAGAVEADGVTDVQAHLSAAVNPNSEATTYRFEWGVAPGVYTDASPESAPITGAAAQTASATAGGLAPETTYYARVVATNTSGTTNGPEMSFTTTAPGAPSATTLPATDVDAASAQLNASINPENAVTTYAFEWGPAGGGWQGSVPTPGKTLAAGASAVPVSTSLTGLEPHTTYRYRVVATSASGTTTGAAETFTTDAIAPTASTSPATGITAGGATLAGTVNPGNSATTYRFEWGTTDLYGSSLPLMDAFAGDNHADHAVSEVLTGLAPSTTYHFRLVSTNGAASAFGPDRTFTTAAVAPAAVTGAADAIGTATATLHAAIDPYNDASTTYRFEWGPTNAYGSATAELPLDAPAGQGSREQHAVITGLVPGTMYHFRVVATSGGGTTPGQDASFTTAAVPAAGDPPADGGGPAAGGGDPPASGDPGTGGDRPPAPQPKLGRTAVASATAGTVRIRIPGSAKSVPLGDAAAIPSGAVIDARKGTLELESALDAHGRRQSALFRGAVFRLSLARKGGMVDLTLTQHPAGCARHGGRARRAAVARSAAAVRAVATRAKKQRKKPKRRAPVSLWGKDSKGKYRTHGRNSVATVRGTEWVTTETCAGTVTRVVHGAVAVKDLRTLRTKLVRAGQRYLARSRR